MDSTEIYVGVDFPRPWRWEFCQSLRTTKKASPYETVSDGADSDSHGGDFERLVFGEHCVWPNPRQRETSLARRLARP